VILFHIFAGRGVVSIKKIKKKDFILEYTGELISGKEAKRREEEGQTGFRYFFRFNEKPMW